MPLTPQRHPKGKGWYAVWKDADGHKRRALEPDKELAIERGRREEKEARRIALGIVDKVKRIRFIDFSLTYLDNHAKVNKRSWNTTDIHYLKKLNGYFGDRYMDEISPDMVERYKIFRQQDIKVSTINRELSCLRCIFNKAIAWGMFSGINPMKRVKLFKENNTRVRYLETNEIARLLHECDEPLKSIVVVALNTGMRKAEIQQLRWEDIDFNRNVIVIRKQKNGETSYQPINETVREALVASFKGKTAPFEYDWKKAFNAAVKRAGLKDFHFHDLRHTYATYLAKKFPLNLVRDLLRQKDIKTTMRYSHVTPDCKQEAVSTLDTIWTPSRKVVIEELSQPVAV